MKPSSRLNVVRLEDRTQPATFGIPWADPNVSVSFAPDGTSIAGRTSNLFSGLNASQSENEWQEDILRAFYTWASHSNLDISVVPDTGATFGTPGRIQNDPRFGDIRVGGNRLASNALAFASPPDPALAGTLAGDVFVNTRYEFKGQPYDLYKVMLHEAGHALGLDHSANPNSPLFPRFNNTVANLTAGDIDAIRSLYGPRVADRHEGASGNGTTGTATGIPVPTGYAGATPLLAFADVSSTADADVFWFDTISGRGENHDVTVRLQSSGISLLGAQVTVYYLDSSGNPKEVANVKSDSADYAGDTLSVSFDGNDDDDHTSRRFFIRVEKAESAPFAVGRYALAVSFDGENTTPAANLSQVILGSYRTLGPNDLAALLQNPNAALVNLDGGANDVLGSATPLTPTVAHNGMGRFEAIGSLGSPGDSDFYRIQAPTGGAPKVLTVNAWALPNQAARPRIAVFDDAGNTVPAEILVNDGGSFTVQAIDLQPGAAYFVRVTGADAESGNYHLSADFGKTATVVRQLAQGQLSEAAPTRTDTLYIGQAQLFHFTLATDAPAGSSVHMTVADSTGAIVFEISALAGETVSGSSVLLRPGEYTITFSSSGAGAAPLAFSVRGNRITDPIGPVVDDPTLSPLYEDPIDPGFFLYPGNIYSIDPYYWFAVPYSSYPGYPINP